MPLRRFKLFEVAVVVDEHGHATLDGLNHTDRHWHCDITSRRAPDDVAPGDGSYVEVTVTLRAVLRGEIVTGMQGQHAMIAEETR